MMQMNSMTVLARKGTKTDVLKRGATALGRSSRLVAFLLGALCLGFVSTASDAAAQLPACPDQDALLEEFAFEVEEAKRGAFLVCKKAEDTSIGFTFTTTAEGPGVDDARIFRPEVEVFGATDAAKDQFQCRIVYLAPSGSGIGPDTVAITEQVPDGFQIDNVCVINVEEGAVSTMLEPPGTNEISGQIDSGKLGCVAIYTNVPDGPMCGDGIVDPERDETCDPPGSFPDPDFPDNECREDCTYCGDGMVNHGEECDPNDPDGPPCTDTCELIECGLMVEKACELPPPPAPPEGKCEGKLQQYTMIWNGNEDITIEVGDGLTSSTQSEVAPGEEVTFFTDGSTNDTIVNIVGGGESTFHVSCSDKDMDGDTTTNEDQQQVSSFGRDCGKDQGDGKGDSGFNNEWLLEGFIDDDGAVLDCTTDDEELASVCEFNAIPADCDNPDKPDNLTWLYTGAGCDAMDNDQDSGDLFCDEFRGGVAGSPAVTITDDDDNVFNVELGGVFTTTRGASKVFTLVDNGGIEENGRHVSCSQPLQAGDVYGSLTLVGLDGLGLGTNVTYSYLVSNAGPGPVTGISVTDDQLGDIGTIASLGVGDSETLTADAFISTTTTNQAFVEGDASGEECKAESNEVLVDVLPPPPCDVGIELDKLEDDKIKWKLTNNSVFGTATLQTLTLGFPSGFDVIEKVKLDGDIYKSNDSDLVVGPGVTIGEDDWTEDNIEKRQIELGKTEKLEIEFEEKDKTASPSDFDLFLTFEEGCTVRF